MANTLKIKRGLAASIPQGQLAEPLFTSDTYDLYIGKGAGGNQRIQNYIASGTSSQFLKGDGSLDSNTYQTALTFSSPLVNTSGTVTINQSSGSADGYLSSTDWTTFNSKEPAITAGTTSQYYRGDKTFQTLDTAAVPENGAIYFTEPRVRATVLTGLNLSGGGTISASDSILTAFGKVQNQISALVGGATYQGTWNANTNTPTLASGTGTKGYYYVVSVAGSTDLDGITDWKVGDWAIFNGTTWDKVDNTDAVSSVNGFTGAVNLALDNISDVSAASPTNAQLLRFNGTSSLWENWTPTFEPALTKGNLTEATSSVLTITGGTGAVIGSGTTIAVSQASGSTSGYLSSTDWSTFNAKEPAVTKGNLTEATSSVLTITGGTGAVIGSGTTIAVASAGAAQAGVVTTGTQTLAGLKTFQVSGSYVNLAQFYNDTNSKSLFIYSDPSGTGISNLTAFGGEGIYFYNGGNYLEFSTNGSPRARMTNTGLEVGYTTTQGTYKLDVNGTARLTGALNGTSATFSGNLTTNSGVNYFNGTTDSVTYYQIGGTSGGHVYLTSTKLELSAYSTRNMLFETNGVTRLTIASTGAATFSENVTISKNQNALTRLIISNTTAGTGAYVETSFTSDSSAGSGAVGKYSSTTTAYKIITGSNTYLYNGGTAGDIAILNDFASGSIKMAAGGSTTAHFTIASTGAATFSAGVGVNGATLQTGLGAGLTIEGATYAPAYFSNSGTLRGFVSGYSGGLLIQASTGNLTLNNSGGNVGIGTTAPGATLDVNGMAYFRSASGIFSDRYTAYSGGNVTIQYGASGNFIVEGGPGGGPERMRITSGGNVGIGTTAPDNVLTVFGTNNSLTSSQGNINVYTSETAGIDIGGSIGLGGYYNGTSLKIPFANITGKKENATSNDANGYLAFLTRSSAGTAERMRITSVGEVLINTTTDSGDYKLQVNGNTYTAGTITTHAPAASSIGTAWKLGGYTATTVVASTSGYLLVEVGGTTYYVGLVSPL